MKNLKLFLEQDLSKKTKNELIEMLSGLEKILTPAVYEQISGISPSELHTLNKKDILEIIDSVKNSYSPEWENALANVPREMINLLSELMKDEEFLATDYFDSDFNVEMGSIDFARIIGGPLQACVTAQADASVSTIDFINQVAYEDFEHTQLKMAKFNYKKSVPQESGEYKIQNAEIEVPFISLVNIPCLRIENCAIDFNVKLNSIYTRLSDYNSKGNTGGGFKFLFIRFGCDVSRKRTTSTGIKIEKEYSLNVKVTATNDEMPAGLEKVLGLLSNTY